LRFENEAYCRRFFDESDQKYAPTATKPYEDDGIETDEMDD
jgi:hypothetical protein